MIIDHPANVDSPRHFGSGYLKFLMVEGHDSTCSYLNLLLLFIFTAHCM